MYTCDVEYAKRKPLVYTLAQFHLVGARKQGEVKVTSSGKRAGDSKQHDWLICEKML